MRWRDGSPHIPGMTSSHTPPGTDFVAAARTLAAEVRLCRDEAERLRQTPPDLAERIARAGLYQLYLPRSIGGPELDPLTTFAAVEEISRADGSVGWNVMIANAMAHNLCRLPAEVGRELAGTPADYRAAGSARPGGPSAGRLHEVPGGFRVSGRWNFASGIHQARWLYCTCVVMEGDKARRNAQGRAVLRAVWVPRDSVSIIDTWSTVGMRGTGSQDFSVEDVFVPAHRSVLSDALPAETGALYHHRARFVIIWTPSAANALGIARGALDALIEIAGSEASTLSPTLLRDRLAVQARIGEAEAIVNAARAYVIDAVGRIWHKLKGGIEPDDHDIAQGRLAIVHAMHEAVRAVDKVFHAAGTNAIFTGPPLERAFRDVHVALQHGAALPSYFESAGKVMLGLRPGDVGW